MNHNSIDGVVQSLVKKSGFIDFEQSNAPCNWSFQNPLEVRFLRFSIETKKALIFRALKINGVNLRDYSRSVTITDSDGETYDLEQINLTGNLVFCAKTRKDPWVSIDLQTTIRMEGLSIELAKENYLKRDMLSLNIEHSTESKNWETIHDNYAIFSTSEFHEFSLENQIMTASYCRNHSLLSDLFELNRKPDDLQSKQELLKNANNLLSQFGVAYGAHQFTRTFALLSEKEKNFKIGELVNLLNFFNDKLAISSFASSGSLLGIVREGGLIGHDDDFDMCYLSNESEKDKILSERTSVIKSLTEAGYKVERGSDCGHLWCTSPKGVLVDIFTGWTESGRCIMHPLDKTGIDLSEILPLSRRRIHGHDVYVPRSPEKLLVLNYGSDWNTPSPFWKFDWSQVKNDFLFLY